MRDRLHEILKTYGVRLKTPLDQNCLVESLIEGFRRECQRTASDPLDPLVIGPERAVDGPTIIEFEMPGAPSSGDEAKRSGALSARSRSAEPMRFREFDELYDLMYEEIAVLESESDSLDRDEVNVSAILKEYGWTVRRNSDGERSEHRADNA